jgi:prepilin-type N-terminal cleavage/methylation domain-containing protein
MDNGLLFSQFVQQRLQFTCPLAVGQARSLGERTWSMRQRESIVRRERTLSPCPAQCRDIRGLSADSTCALEKQGRADRLQGFPINRTHSSVGFTLVELLIVVAIIALLFGILLPAMASARRSAKAVVCGANLRRIGMALNMYAKDNRDFYPRALPLAPGANPAKQDDWSIPWPSDMCPMFWQAGYPSLLIPYLSDVRIGDPYDYPGLPSQMGDSFKSLFRCPGNTIDLSDLAARKCGYPLDYGLHNRASQNRMSDPLIRRAFLAADQTWGLAFVQGKNGPNAQLQMPGWWSSFVHPMDTINVLTPTYGVERFSREEFIRQFDTANPPLDDSL